MYKKDDEGIKNDDVEGFQRLKKDRKLVAQMKSLEERVAFLEKHLTQKI